MSLTANNTDCYTYEYHNNLYRFPCPFAREKYSRDRRALGEGLGPLPLGGSTPLRIVKPRKGIAGPSGRFGRVGGYRARV